MSGPRAGSKEQIHDFWFSISPDDVGKLIGKAGKQAKFIQEKSGLEIFSIRDDQSYTDWGRQWTPLFVRGDRRAIEMAMRLVDSTRRSYYEREQQTLREQLETALTRIQELEEADMQDCGESLVPLHDHDAENNL